MLILTAVIRPLIAMSLCCVLVTVAGCRARSSSAQSKIDPVAVVIEQPIERDVADFAEFTGRTDSVESVEVRARVSGYLMKINFKPGKEVAAGDLLFEIDPRPYDAELQRSDGALATAEASLKQSKAEMSRAEGLRSKGISTQADYDKAIADLSHAEAAIQSSKATVVQAKLNQDFTKVTAPISGRTSRQLITEGNLVTADNTALTTIVSLDPMYAYFDIDERTLLEIQKRIRDKTMESARERDDIEVRLGLANEEGFPHVGVVDLVDNRVNAGTGTIQVRGRFPNADRVLTAGLFVRVQFQMGPARKRLLISEKALAQQQGQRYVYVVNSDRKVERRSVTVGRRDGPLRVIETGLQMGDNVVVKGQQRIRPGVEVVAKSESQTAQRDPAVGQPHPR